MHSDDGAKLDLVRRWTEAWNRLDWDGVAETFAVDGLNQSMMHPPMRGREEIRDRTRLVMEKLDAINLRLVRVGVLDGVVVAERIDECRRQDGSWRGVPVAGFYEIADGLITAKRDYYDRRQLMDAMGLSTDLVPDSSENR